MSLVDELRLLGWVGWVEQDLPQSDMPKRKSKTTAKPAPSKRLTPKDEGYFSPEYLEYLKSKDWVERRKRINPKRCGGCGTTKNLQLNHLAYPPKGAPLQAFIDQDDSDFCYLCSNCHRAITLSVRRRRKKKKCSNYSYPH